MQYFRTIWRVGVCVLVIGVAQALSQAPAASPNAPPTATVQPAASQPAAATDPSGNKTTTPIIPGLTNLPSSQAGPPQTPSNTQLTAPASLQISSGDLLDVNVYGVPDLAQKVRVSNSGDGYFPLLGNI